MSDDFVNIEDVKQWLLHAQSKQWGTVTEYTVTQANPAAAALVNFEIRARFVEVALNLTAAEWTALFAAGTCAAWLHVNGNRLQFPRFNTPKGLVHVRFKNVYEFWIETTADLPADAVIRVRTSMQELPVEEYADSDVLLASVDGHVAAIENNTVAAAVDLAAIEAELLVLDTVLDGMAAEELEQGTTLESIYSEINGIYSDTGSIVINTTPLYGL